MPDALAHTPTHKPGTAPVMNNRPTTGHTNTKPPAPSSVSFLQAYRGLLVPKPLLAPCTTNSKALPHLPEAAQATQRKPQTRLGKTTLSLT